MQKHTNNNAGFAHPILFVGVIGLVIGLIGFSGHRVWVTSKARQSGTTSSSQPEQAVTTSVSKEAEKVTVNKTGTGAASVKKTTASRGVTAPTIAEQVQINTKYDLKTPEGSLNQLVTEIRSQNFTNALYLISPRFLSLASGTLQVPEPVNLDACKAHSSCNFLLNANIGVINPNMVYDYSSGSSKGKSLVFNLKWQNGTLISQHPRYGGDYTITVDMLDAGDHWVVDRVTVNGYTI